MTTHPYDRLDPDMIIDAVESVGYLSDARLLALNSYENRVYQVGIEDSAPLIAKFYRPDRWSEAQIKEEHHFSLELQDAEISVVAPIVDDQGVTLHYLSRTFSLHCFPAAVATRRNWTISTTCWYWAEHSGVSTRWGGRGSSRCGLRCRCNAC